MDPNDTEPNDAVLADDLDALASEVDATIAKLDPVVPYGTLLAEIGAGTNRRLIITSNAREGGGVERLTFAAWEHTEHAPRMLPVPRGAVTLRSGDLPVLARVLVAALRRARASAVAAVERDAVVRARKVRP